MQTAQGSTSSTWVNMIFLLCLFPSLSRRSDPLHWETCLSTYTGWTMTMRWSIPSASHPYSCQIDTWICYYSTMRVYSTTPPLGTIADWWDQLSDHGHTVHCCRRFLHTYSSQELLDAHDFDYCHAQRTKFPNIQKQLLSPFVVRWRWSRGFVWSFWFSPHTFISH